VNQKIYFTGGKDLLTLKINLSSRKIGLGTNKRLKSL